MLGEHKEQREVGSESGVKEGCDAGENPVWQDTSTGSQNNIMKKVIFLRMGPRIMDSRTGCRSK